MKFVKKGKCKSLDDLPEAELPENAVCYEEPETLEDISMTAVKYSLMALGLAFAAGLGKAVGNGFDVHIGYVFLGWILSYLAIIPHELLHGIWYPRGSVVEIWSSIENGLFFVTCCDAVSKSRFILMSIFPSLIFGIIPVIVYIFIPETIWASMLFGFGAANVSNGGGDYLNIHNTIKQVPAGAMIANSGVHTYWWKKEKIKGEQNDKN